MSDPISRLQLARQEIDRTFGDGYAAAPPELVAVVMQSASSDYAAHLLASRHRARRRGAAGADKGATRRIQNDSGALKYLPARARLWSHPDDAALTEGDTTMSPCWACGGAPPSWFFVCEECGGRAVSSKSGQEEMERVERDYWQGARGQYSNPFRSRPPELGFIAPAIPNPVLF